MPAGEACFEPFAIWELPMPNCNGFSELTQTDFKKIKTTATYIDFSLKFGIRIFKKCPAINGNPHVSAEQNCAHSALTPLPTAILPFLSKRLATVRDGCPCDLRALKRSRTGFCQDQTSQTRRKGTVRHTRPCKPAGIQNTHHKKRAAEDFCGALVL